MQGPQDLYLCHILSSVTNGKADPPSPRGCCPKQMDDDGFSSGLPPPPLCPTNSKILKKYGPNRSVRWTRRSVPNEFGT